MVVKLIVEKLLAVKLPFCVEARRGLETGYARCEIGLGFAAGSAVLLALSLLGGTVRSIRAKTS